MFRHILVAAAVLTVGSLGVATVAFATSAPHTPAALSKRDPNVTMYWGSQYDPVTGSLKRELVVMKYDPSSKNQWVKCSRAECGKLKVTAKAVVPKLSAGEKLCKDSMYGYEGGSFYASDVWKGTKLLRRQTASLGSSKLKVNLEFASAMVYNPKLPEPPKAGGK